MKEFTWLDEVAEFDPEDFHDLPLRPDPCPSGIRPGERRRIDDLRRAVRTLGLIA